MRFESSEIVIPTVTPWIVSTSHGLGRVPDVWQATLRCKISNAGSLGWGINEEVVISSNLVGSSVVGIQCWATATLVGCSLTAGAADIYVVNRSSGVSGFITKGNFRIVLRAVTIG